MFREFLNGMHISGSLIFNLEQMIFIYSIDFAGPTPIESLTI